MASRAMESRASEGDMLDADDDAHEASCSWPLSLRFLPPGFRFHPTDDELVGFYLRRKASGLEVPSHLIADVDLYKHDPWKLPSLSPLSPSTKDSQWFFFNFSDKKYPKGPRTNRATLSGYWKATGRDRSVSPTHHLSTHSHTAPPPASQLSVQSPQSSAAPPTHNFCGIKKTLVFYQGRAPHGKRTPWVMHEFHLSCSSSPSKSPSSSSPLSSNIVLCRIVKKNSNPPQPSNILGEDYEREHDQEDSIHV